MTCGWGSQCESRSLLTKKAISVAAKPKDMYMYEADLMSLTRPRAGNYLPPPHREGTLGYYGNIYCDQQNHSFIARFGSGQLPSAPLHDAGRSQPRTAANTGSASSAAAGHPLRPSDIVFPTISRGAYAPHLVRQAPPIDAGHAFHSTRVPNEGQQFHEAVAGTVSGRASTDHLYRSCAYQGQSTRF